MIKRKQIVDALVTLVLLVGAVFMLFPLLWAVLASLKSTTKVFDFGLPEEWLFSNYPEALAAGNWLRYFTNSAIMAGGLKDFFDRTFYPTQGSITDKPCGIFVTHGGGGKALESVQSIF